PVLGYIWLRARCRDCGLPISPRYPLVEAAIGGWFAAAFLYAGPWIDKGAVSVFGAFLLVIAFIDFDHQRLPIWQTVAMTALGLGLQPWLGWARWGLEPSDHSLALAFGAALVGGLSVILITAIGRLLGVENGLAFGDALALALIGAFLGPRGALVAFLVGSAAAFLVYAPRLLSTRRRRWEQPIPFVTFLALGAASALVAGPLSST
ncbi:MAG: A24 family peptidase, partial [Acidobacteriota bacterium]